MEHVSGVCAMTKPRLLDLFCGAGGAAMGYSRAGFGVVGVDIKPQPRYPFEFVQADAMTYPLDGFDAIHASPPCQGYSRMRHLPWLKDRVYPLLLAPTRDRLVASGIPWVIENVMDAPLGGIWLCGTMFGRDLLRHRRFESSVFMLQPGHSPHQVVLASGGASLAKRYAGHGITGAAVKEVSRDSIAGHFANIARARILMDIDWMNRDELAESIPPYFTEHVGRELMNALRVVA